MHVKAIADYGRLALHERAGIREGPFEGFSLGTFSTL